MKFGMNPSPYFRSKRSTAQIMLELMIGLIVIWVCAVVFYFTTGTGNGLRAVFNPIVAMASAVVTEALFMLPKFVKEKGSFRALVDKLLHSYGYISGLILALILPVATSWYAIVVSTVLAIAVGKMLFGGFGHNIFNPAILGRIIAQTAFFSQMKYDTVLTTGSTITSTMGNNGWGLDLIGSAGNPSLLDLLLGNYRGALGETFTLIILLVGIVLAIRRVIDWRAPIFYLGGLYLATFFMGLTGGYGLDSFEYALVQLSVGGAMFGAVFCITDPVTSPTSPSGRITFALGAVVFTVLIRFMGSAPEGVAYSILLMNMLTPLIDSAIKGLSHQFTRKKIVTTCVLSAIVLASGCVAGATKIDKIEYMNYRSGQSEDSKRLLANVVRSGEADGLEIYTVTVTGNLQTNDAFTYGNITELFREELEEYQSYFDDPALEAKYVAEKNVLSISYLQGEKEVTVRALTLSTVASSEANEDGSKNWIIRTNKNKVTVPTGYSNTDYKTVYSTAIDKDLNVVVTFASDHTSAEETQVSYSSMSFDVYIDWEAQTIHRTELISTGAGGGVGDAMLDGSLNFNIGEYTITAAKAELAEAFYHDYIEIAEPVPFEAYAAYANDSFLIGEVDDAIKVGATYTANGYMYAINSVIAYAKAYHQSLKAGKVGM